MDITITNFFNHPKNPKKIILRKKGVDFKTLGVNPGNPGDVSSYTIIDFNPADNWTIHVDFNSPKNNKTRFWVMHEDALKNITIERPPNKPDVVKEIQYPNKFKLLRIKKGKDPLWFIDITQVTFAKAGGSGNVTVGDDNQLPFYRFMKIKWFLQGFMKWCKGLKVQRII